MAVTKAQLLEHAPNSPALAAPPGLTHDFVNPVNFATEYYIELVICMTVSFLVVCMRIWTKARLIRKFGREDWVCLLAFALFCGYCAYLPYLIKGGGRGVHQWDMNLITLSKQLSQFRIAIIIYGVAVFTIKLAVLLEFLRIFSPGKNNSTFWIYHSLIWLNFLFYVIVTYGFWSLGEMTSGFLATCLPVSPKFFQSFKEITIPSWVPRRRDSSG